MKYFLYQCIYKQTNKCTYWIKWFSNSPFHKSWRQSYHWIKCLFFLRWLQLWQIYLGNGCAWICNRLGNRTGYLQVVLEKCNAFLTQTLWSSFHLSVCVCVCRHTYSLNSCMCWDFHRQSGFCFRILNTSMIKCLGFWLQSPTQTYFRQRVMKLHLLEMLLTEHSHAISLIDTPPHTHTFLSFPHSPPSFSPSLRYISLSLYSLSLLSFFVLLPSSSSPPPFFKMEYSRIYLA